jgi:anthranilate phosphoribosyltransferase
MDSLKPVLAQIANGTTLSRNEAEAAFDYLLSGDATSAQMGAFLMALRVRGETIDEITGAVSAFRARMLRIKAPADAIDIVGTGGDGHGTYNVSTLAAMIVAACGVPVAKHGNRAASSRSGSSDVLAALGVRIGGGTVDVERCLAEANIGFMSAQSHHAAMRHFAAVRSDLGIRTIFNVLGPLSNPASVTRIMVGVFATAWLEPLARVLGNLGTERAWLVHGADGLDEITTTGPTSVVSIEDGKLETFTIVPETYGIARASLADLKGGDPAHNAAALRGVLDGEKNAYRDIAVLNAAGALTVAGKVSDLHAGVAMAVNAIDSGQAKAVLDRLILSSNSGLRAAAG